jgi:WD40 repeat protein/serine/threonine protein kinase
MTNANDAQRRAQAEQIFAAWASRVEAGEELDFEAVLAANSAVARELSLLHDDWKLFAPLMAAVVPGSLAGSERPRLVSLAHTELGDEGDLQDSLLEDLGLQHPLDGNRYRFRSRIGQGGGGVVLKVWDTKLNRPLAMKFVLGRAEEERTGRTPGVDRRTLSRFVDEARIASQLNHPGIVPVHDLGVDGAGRAFFTMKLVKGDDLSRIFEKVARAEDGWSLTRAVGVLLSVCEAMAYAHDHGVIHRDLKPANIMVGAYGEVHVMDWGLARVTDDSRRTVPEPEQAEVGRNPTQIESMRRLNRVGTPDSPLVTHEGDAVGTPNYMSLEQARGDLAALGPATDIYSVGAMLYQLLTGEPPYMPGRKPLPAAVVLMNVLHGPPRAVEALAPRAIPELVAICERAMARSPSDRYPSMGALANDLRAFLEGRVVAAHETGTWAETRKWVLRNKALASTFAALLATAVIGGAAFALKREEALAAVRVSTERQQALEKSEGVAQWRSYVAAIRGAQSAQRSGDVLTTSEMLASAPQNLRNWEWSHLDAESDKSLLTLVHPAAVWDAQFSPDGTRIVTACSDGIARVWDANAAEVVLELAGHVGRLTSATYSPDGQRIATSSVDDTARVWDALNGNLLLTLEGDEMWLESVSFDAKGTRLITGSADHTARVFDAANGALLTVVAPNRAWIFSAEFGPDGGSALLSTGHFAGVLWDLETNQLRTAFEGHSNQVHHASFSADGRRVVTASRDETAIVWDVTDTARRVVLSGHTDRLDCARFSPDGNRVVTASYDNSARIWDATTGAELASLLGHSRQLHSAAFDPSGTRVVTASSDGTARVWDAASADRMRSPLRVHVPGLDQDLDLRTVSQDGSRVLARDANGFGIWSIQDCELLARIGDASDGIGMASYVADDSYIVTTSIDGWNATLWCASTGAALDRVVVDDESLARASRETGSLHELTCAVVEHFGVSERGAPPSDIVQRVRSLIPGVLPSRVLASSPSQGLLVLATASEELVVHDISERLPPRTLSTQARVGSAAFSADGRRLAIELPAGEVEIWDIPSGTGPLVTVRHPGGCHALAFSADGARLLTGGLNDSNAMAWDCVTGETVAVLQGHQDAVDLIVLGPDETRVVTSSWDGDCIVWDATTYEKLIELSSPGIELSNVKFSSDGSRLLATGFEGDEVRTFAYDSVPFRARHSERNAIERARADAERWIDAAIAEEQDWLTVARLLRADRSLDPLVKRAAADVLTSRSNRALLASEVSGQRWAERTWIARMLGRESWPPEDRVEREVRSEQDLPADAEQLDALARELVDASDPAFGFELRALVLARLAVEALDRSIAPTDRALRSSLRDTLAQACYRSGRFDEAVRELELAVEESEGARRDLFEERLRTLRTQVATWRNEGGSVNAPRWLERLEELELEFADDPDVVPWLRPKR